MKDEMDELERVLQEGISRYADAEPLAGLEERIIARVRMTESSRSSRAEWWAVLAVGVAALVVGGFVHLGVGHTESRPLSIAAVEKAAVPDLKPKRTAAIKVFKPSVHSHSRAPLPKQPEFPTPSPLTSEERLLLAMVKQDPERTAQAFDSLRKRESEPLEIAPLVIPPLEAGEGQLERKNL
jgi:hypothetical protein